MKKIPLVFICGVGLGIILLSAFGKSTTTQTSAFSPATENIQPAVADTALVNSPAISTDTPAALDINNLPTHNAAASAEVTPEALPEEPKVWCERHPERCKHIHERKAKYEALRIEKLQSLCEKQPENKKCEELKEIASLPDKQDEVSNESAITEKQLEKHLEEHR